ncbi:MAG TPA: hypothetical protein VFZ66_17190 [Herpetosiphonaceae bacterium]
MDTSDLLHHRFCWHRAVVASPCPPSTGRQCAGQQTRQRVQQPTVLRPARDIPPSAAERSVLQRPNLDRARLFTPGAAHGV